MERKIKKYLRLTGIMTLLLLSTGVQAQKWDWAKRVYHASADNNVYGLTKDASGNLYYVGYSTEDPVFPNSVTISGAADDPDGVDVQGYVVKVAPNGTYQWAKRVNARTIHQNVHCFSNGNIGVTGVGLRSDFTFNGVTHAVVNQPKYDHSYFLLHDANGNESSAIVFRITNGLSIMRECFSVQSDKVYLTLSAYDTIFYNNTYVATPAGQKHGLFTFVINSSGQVEKVFQLGASQNTPFSFFHTAVNSREQVYWAMGINRSADFGNGISSANPNNYKRLVIVKFDSDGTALWLNHSDTDVLTTGNLIGLKLGIGLDSEDNLYILDSFKEKMIWGGQTYTTLTAAIHTPFVVKINDQGQLVWINVFNKTVAGTSEDDDEVNLAYNGKGFLYGLGQTTANIYFGDIFRDNKTIGDNYTEDLLLYLLKIDTTGVVNRVRFFDVTSSDEQFPHAMQIDGDKVYVGGTALQGAFMFDNNPRLIQFWTGPSQYRYDAFLASYTDCNAQISRSGNVFTASSGVSYQWYRNGASISNETNASYTVTQSGNYAVEVTFAGGCVSRSATVPVNSVVTGVSVAAEQQVSLSVYPNPASDAVTLSLHQPGDGASVDVEFYNQQGALVMGMQYPNWADEAEYVVDLKAFAPGMYCAKTRCGNKQSTTTFVKQ